jgi:ERCC4-type nuclease
VTAASPAATAAPERTAKAKAAAAPLRLVCDTREQLPLQFSPGVVVVRGTLETADYAVEGLEHLALVERKGSIDELAGNLTWERARFWRELQRMVAVPVRVIVVEDHLRNLVGKRYQSRATPQSLLASLSAIFVRFQVPVIWAGDHAAAAVVVEDLLRRVWLDEMKRRAEADAKPAAERFAFKSCAEILDEPDDDPRPVPVAELLVGNP